MVEIVWLCVRNIATVTQALLIIGRQQRIRNNAELGMYILYMR